MEEKAKLLRRVATFRSLSEAEIGLVAEDMDRESAEADRWVYREGEPGDRMYVLAEGEVEARRGEGEGSTVARFVPGDSFGEAELWSGIARETGAFATRASSLLCFPRRGASLRELEQTHPRIFVKLLWSSVAEVAGRVRSTNALIAKKTPWMRALEGAIYTDALTSLGNRRWLEEELRRAGRSSRVALVVLKPDLFKGVNDSYGHEEGDRALKAVAAEMRRIVPPPGVVARLGGDEFAVLLPGIDAEEARGVSRSLLRALEGFKVHPAGAQETPLGFRGGLACAPLGEAHLPALPARAVRHVLAARATGSELVYD